MHTDDLAEKQRKISVNTTTDPSASYHLHPNHTHHTHGVGIDHLTTTISPSWSGYSNAPTSDVYKQQLQQKQEELMELQLQLEKAHNELEKAKKLIDDYKDLANKATKELHNVLTDPK